MTLRVVPVRSRAERKSWAGVPTSLYADDPAYVPELRTDALAAMNPKKNPFHNHARIEHFLLLRDDTAVGRIAATVHPAYIRRFGRQVGFFGFLDCPPEEECYRLLLGAAEKWVREAGMAHLAGPYNYWSGSEFGVLTSGHDRPPALFQTWHPAGVREHLEGLGFAARTELAGFEIGAGGLAAVRDSLLASSDRISAATGVTTRPLDMRAFAQDMTTVRSLFAEAFASSSENLPYPRDVFDSMVSAMKPFVDPELVRIAERDGEPIGFSFTIPNVNQVLARLRGRLTLRDLLSLRSYKRSIDEVVVLLVGVQPSTPMGVAHVLFADTLRAVERGGYQTVHTTWVHEENAVMRALLSGAVGAGITRSWAVMEREVAP